MSVRWAVPILECQRKLQTMCQKECGNMQNVCDKMKDRTPDKMSAKISERMSDRMPGKCPNICLIKKHICQIESQIKCQNICQTECQRKCENICHMKCRRTWDFLSDLKCLNLCQRGSLKVTMEYFWGPCFQYYFGNVRQEEDGLWFGPTTSENRQFAHICPQKNCDLVGEYGQ